MLIVCWFFWEIYVFLKVGGAPKQGFSHWTHWFNEKCLVILGPVQEPPISSLFKQLEIPGRSCESSFPIKPRNRNMPHIQESKNVPRTPWDLCQKWWDPLISSQVIDIYIYLYIYISISFIQIIVMLRPSDQEVQKSSRFSRFDPAAGRLCQNCWADTWKVAEKSRALWSKMSKFFRNPLFEGVFCMRIHSEKAAKLGISSAGHRTFLQLLGASARLKNTKMHSGHSSSKIWLNRKHAWNHQLDHQ